MYDKADDGDGADAAATSAAAATAAVVAAAAAVNVAGATAATTAAASPPPMCSPAGWREGVAYSRRSSSYRNSTVRSVAGCCEDCSKDEQCLAWNYKLPSTNCFLWHTVPALAPGTPTQHSTIGTKFPPAPPPSPAPPPPPAPKGALNVL